MELPIAFQPVRRQVVAKARQLRTAQYCIENFAQRCALRNRMRRAKLSLTRPVEIKKFGVTELEWGHDVSPCFGDLLNLYPYRKGMWYREKSYCYRSWP